ncbi:hypothetical protein ABMC88_04750 [Sulfitobacter sp. HNIBRBA2951]|uniref:hypothetical protein n=1 Tax=Sulfitobacter aquimarinus TaxID=3158557 RepID=UPI0032DED176
MILLFAPIIIGVVAYLAWRNRDIRSCRWREDRTGDKGALRMYRCVSCGAEAFTATKGPPQTCKKGLGNSPL